MTHSNRDSEKHQGRQTPGGPHRRTFATSDLSEWKASAIAASRMAPEHDYLNAVLEHGLDLRRGD